jgi:periplasmic divalent cation tolerance protein
MEERDDAVGAALGDVVADVRRQATDELVEVRVTAGSREEAQRLADLLVDERLAACVQLVEVTSCYRWQDAIEREPELLLLAKSTNRRFPRLLARVREAHSYDTPEVLAVPVVAADEEYAEWVRESVRS